MASYAPFASETVTIKGSHSLEIRGFSLTKGMGVGQYISSDPFLVGGHCWEIQFYPNGKNKDESGDIYVSFNIALVSKPEEVVMACFEYVLLDRSGNKWHKGQKEFFFASYVSGPHTHDDSNMVWGYSRFYKRTELEASQFIKDDCLTIQCTGVLKTSPETFSKPLPLSDSYKQLLESSVGSDVSFEVEGETFCAHKALLHFIYCDVIPDVGKVVAGLDSKEVAIMMIQHLLAATDRYGIERLRLLCEARLCQNIAINNVATSLALAEQHSCSQLKRMCLKFIGLPENLEAVMQTDGFKNLKESCPGVIVELLESVARVKDYSCVSFLEGDAEGKRVKLMK
ncbi:hypothetical protein RD792_015076 [Penstemon davidsonii]|uniref:MATH domain-containing protein n=1 Tax=Penstemon davidsonii TaxID=160366 RepID=A0ABR0CTB1_9LAMI|nr:hypothetical protein RD792_015076 [Penstemon davidsonii]